MTVSGSSDKQPKWAFEDFEVGREVLLDEKLVTAEEIIDFAGQFDPQPMHLNEEDGEASILGGLSASGFHTASMLMRMMCDRYLLDSTSQGSPGIDFLNWRKPVLAGDTLTGSTTILSKRRSKSRPEIGIIEVEHRLQNQRGEVVCEIRNSGMFGLRNPEAPYVD